MPHRFVTTERHQFCLVAYDNTSSDVMTICKGSIADRTGRAAGAVTTLCVPLRTPVAGTSVVLIFNDIAYRRLWPADSD